MWRLALHLRNGDEAQITQRRRERCCAEHQNTPSIKVPTQVEIRVCVCLHPLLINNAFSCIYWLAVSTRPHFALNWNLVLFWEPVWSSQACGPLNGWALWLVCLGGDGGIHHAPVCVAPGRVHLEREHEALSFPAASPAFADRTKNKYNLKIVSANSTSGSGMCFQTSEVINFKFNLMRLKTK